MFARMVVLGATAGPIAAGLAPSAGQAAAPSATSHAELQRALDKTVNARIPGAVLLARKGGGAVTSKDAPRQSVILVNAGDGTIEREDNGARQQLVERAYRAG